MCQDGLKERLINIINLGLSATAIAEHAGINYDILSKFKQGRLLLITEDAEKLAKYLDKVELPDW